MFNPLRFLRRLIHSSDREQGQAAAPPVIYDQGRPRLGPPPPLAPLEQAPPPARLQEREPQGHQL